MGRDLRHLWLEDFSASVPPHGCDSYIRVIAVLPTSVTPKPAFALTEDQDWQKFAASLASMRVEANFVGVFEPYYVWRENKLVQIVQDVPSAFSKNGDYDARLILRDVSGVDAKPIPRK